MNEQSPYNFGLANKIETRLQDIQSGRDLTSPAAVEKTESKASTTIGGIPAEEFGKLLATVEEKAALSGSFEPDNIVDTATPTSARLLLLTRLVTNCTTQTINERIYWTLKQNRRKIILTQLINENKLTVALDQPLPETDRLGVWLRRLLRDEPISDLQQLDRDELLSLAHAIEALNGVPGLVYLPELSDILRNVEMGRFLADYDILLLNGFYGREKELEELRQFLQRPKPTPSANWEGLLLTGLGGAGKSTLLAKFVKDQAANNACTVGILDFDRPAISPEDTTWLELELSRQVGQQYPETSSDLSQIRKHTRLAKSDIAEIQSKAEQGSKSVYRGLSSIVSEMSRLVQEKQVDHLPFLLVLDTFEEVTQRNLTHKILSWLGTLGERIYPQTLKVIISGRLYGEAINSFMEYQLQKISVDELEPFVAKQLLMNMSVSEKTAEDLVASGAFPLRPLDLKLLAKIIATDPSFSVESRTDGRPTYDLASKQLFAGIVYRRVILRIANEIIRTLAYPGLVLHYLTNDLVQEVLLPALKMAPLSDEQTTEALDTLSTYEWLVHRENDGEVWHRTDIRRSMLQGMTANDPERTKAIHEYAVRYFSRRSAARDQAEGIYHKLMLVEDTESSLPDKVEIISFVQYLSHYEWELPKTAGVFFKYAIQGHVDYRELPWLPDKYRNEGSNNTGRFLCENREFGSALALIKTLTSDNTLIRENWVVDTVYATAEWQLFKQLFPTVTFPTNPASWKEMGNLFFPATIISADLVNTNAFQQAVTTLFNKDTMPEDIDKPLGKLFLAKMAFTLVSLHGKVPLRQDCIHSMLHLIETIYSSTQIKPIPDLRRNLFLLNLAINDHRPLTCLLDLSLFVLNNSWLDNLLEKKAGFQINEPVKNLLQQVRSVLNEFSGSQRRTAEGLLARIDDLNKDDSGELRITVDVDQLKALDLQLFATALNTEFQDPCRFALLEACSDDAAYRQLGTILASLLTWKLDDLEPDTFSANMAINAEHLLEIYVELIDRCGQLGGLLTSASKAFPDAPKLKLVAEAFSDWQQTVMIL